MLVSCWTSIPGKNTRAAPRLPTQILCGGHSDLMLLERHEA